MSKDLDQVKDKIVDLAVEFRRQAIKNAKKMAQFLDDKKKLEKFMTKSSEKNQDLITELFNSIDEYEAIKGKIKDGD